MIFLNPPYYLIEGVTLCGDYNDPRQFYYFPNRPRLAVDEQGRPAIRFLIFKADLQNAPAGQQDATGFLVFDTSLAWPDETLKKVATKIQSDLQLSDPPRLSPLLYKSGTVRVMFLDRATQAPAATPPKAGGAQAPDPTINIAPADERWVPVLEASGVPSLYGENRAIFSAMLTKEATQLLFGAFEGFMPAGVVYDLSFVGMQRAFNVHADVDWQQAYHYVDERYAANFIFVSVDTEKIVADLVEKKIIKFTASLEGVGDESMQGEFNAVRKEIEDFVLDKFFKPAVNPDQRNTGPSTGDQIVSTAQQLRNAIVAWPSVGYSRVQLDTSEIRTLDIDYTIARAVERHIAPQAHLSLFFQDYNLTREQVVTVVNGDDDLWRTVEFDVSVAADFDKEGIAAVTVDIVYGPPAAAGSSSSAPTWSANLDKQTPRIKRKAWYDPATGNQFQYRFAVIFAPAGLPGEGLTLTSEWRTSQGSVLVITPDELFHIRSIEPTLQRNFPSDHFTQVLAHLQYKDPDTSWSWAKDLLLDKDTTHSPVSFRLRHGAPDNVDYRLSFLRTGAQAVEGTWQTTTSDLILVEDPLHGGSLDVQVLVTGDRTKIANLIVDLKYDDPDNVIHENTSLVFAPDTIAKGQSWHMNLSDPAKRRYQYNQTVIYADGSASPPTGWVTTDKTTLLVGDVYARLMEVQPSLVGPPLVNHNLASITLKLHYSDAANAVSVDNEMTFAQPGNGEAWRVQLKDPSARDYSYQVVYTLATGFEQSLGPIAARDTFLVISSIPPRS